MRYHKYKNVPSQKRKKTPLKKFLTMSTLLKRLEI